MGSVRLIINMSHPHNEKKVKKVDGVMSVNVTIYEQMEVEITSIKKLT